MTHPHDTSTPAMSAETVPSEEFVLVPREPTDEMIVAGYAAYNLAMSSIRMFPEAPVASMPSPMGDALRAAISTLSASHLAKEGGEAGAVEVFGPYGWLVKPIGLAEDEWSLESDPAGDEEHAVSVALYALEPQKLGVTSKPADWLRQSLQNCADSLSSRPEELRGPYTLASLPQPSPALAKGGDAVREAAEDERDRLYAAVKAMDGEDPDGVIFSSSHLAWAKHTKGFLTNEGAMLPADRAATRAALSTPTEGPASQTEGMGGDAETILRAALQEYGLDESLLGEHEKLGRHSAIRGMMVRLGLYPVFCELLAKDATDDEIAAALTPPETAEAVPIAAGVEPFVYLREHDMRELAMPASRSRDTRVYRVSTFEGETLHPLYGLPVVARLREDLERVTRERDNARRREKEMAGEKDAAFAELAVVVKALETVREDERDRLYEEAMAQMSSISSRSFASGAFYWLEEEYGALLPADRAAARTASSQGGE